MNIDPNMPIHFFIPGEPDLLRKLELDPDRDWKEMRVGQRWLLHTYLRLKKAGHPVTASGCIPEEGIVIFYGKQIKQLRVELNESRHRNCILVSVRGDGRECPFADFEIIQNRW